MTEVSQRASNTGINREAKEATYRTIINAPDGVDLLVPARAPNSPLGYPGSIRDSDGKTRLAVSARFPNQPEGADITVVGYGLGCDTSGPEPVVIRVPMFVETRTVSAAAAIYRSGPTGVYFTEVETFDLRGAPFWEVRISNLTGCVDELAAWPY